MNAKVVAGLVGVAVVGVIVAAVVVPRLGSSDEESEAAAARAADAGLEVDRGSAEAIEAAARARRLEEDTALAALKAELAVAEPYTGRTDEQRLADAWEWVNANRPADRPYNEVEAKMLALLDVIFDGEERSAEWLMNASLIEVEMLRGMDTDGDGVVSDEELQAFTEENLSAIGGFDHPYIKAKLDTNGDGEVSEDEMAGLERILSPDGAFSGVLARAQIEAWDTDRDGFVSDGERDAGKAGSADRLNALVAEQMKAMEDAGMFEGEGGDARRAEIEAQMAEGVAQAMGENADLMDGMITAQELMEAMRIENMDQQQMQAEFVSSMPQPPDSGSFDLDGDGSGGVTPEEIAAYQEAMAAYQTEMQAYTGDAMGRIMRLQFEHATAQSDLNGDGRLTPDEWDGRLDMLLAQRDQRLFLRSYDLDASGAVGQDELMNFVDWHRAGSLRADANYDGLVDARDLERAMTTYQAQIP